MNNVRPRLVMMTEEQDLLASAPIPEGHDEFIAKGEEFIKKHQV